MGVEVAGASEPSARKEALAADRAGPTITVGHDALESRLAWIGSYAEQSS